MPNDPKEDEIPLEIWCDLTGADSSLGLSFVCPCEFPNDLCISLPLRVDHKAGGSRLTASPICRATQILRSSNHRMKNESTDEARFDAALAHGLARVALGLNIAIHGYSRLPNLAGFANGMVKQFAATFLRGPLVYITGFGIAIGEAVIGTLLFFGLLCRPVLVFGTLLMLLLIFGSALIQQWEIASVQMIYVAFYAGLLATVRYDRFSLDGLRRRK